MYDWQQISESCFINDEKDISIVKTIEGNWVVLHRSGSVLASYNSKSEAFDEWSHY